MKVRQKGLRKCKECQNEFFWPGYKEFCPDCASARTNRMRNAHSIIYRKTHERKYKTQSKA